MSKVISAKELEKKMLTMTNEEWENYSKTLKDTLFHSKLNTKGAQEAYDAI